MTHLLALVRTYEEAHDSFNALNEPEGSCDHSRAEAGLSAASKALEQEVWDQETFADSAEEAKAALTLALREYDQPHIDHTLAAGLFLAALGFYGGDEVARIVRSRPIAPVGFGPCQEAQS